MLLSVVVIFHAAGSVLPSGHAFTCRDVPLALNRIQYHVPVDQEKLEVLSVVPAPLTYFERVKAVPPPTNPAT
jgi:hypothetical protein